MIRRALLPVAAVLATAIGGCTFTGVRREPSPVPSFRYATPALQSVLHGTPVAIDYTDCVEMAIINERGTFGAREFAGTFPLRKIAVREFGRFIDENMRSPMEGETEKLVLKIYSKRILVEQKWSKSLCELDFDVQLVDAAGEGSRPYFRTSVHGEWNGVHKGDDTVPGPVYRAVSAVVTSFAKALASDKAAMRRLALVARPDDRTKPPSLKSLVFAAGGRGVVSGSCEVECNGWDGFDADKWARGQINSSCSMKLGIEPERIRVVYGSDVYDSEKKLWSYKFRAFARAPIVLDYDPVTRNGVCIGDLGLLQLPAQEASRRMKDFVIEEMRTRGGAVKSSAGDKGVPVRFLDVKTDLVDNLLQMAFSLPY